MENWFGSLKEIKSEQERKKTKSAGEMPIDNAFQRGISQVIAILINRFFFFFFFFSLSLSFYFPWAGPLYSDPESRR